MIVVDTSVFLDELFKFQTIRFRLEVQESLELKLIICLTSLKRLKNGQEAEHETTNHFMFDVEAKCTELRLS